MTIQSPGILFDADTIPMKDRDKPLYHQKKP
jgi:hypothetical protein